MSSVDLRVKQHSNLTIYQDDSKSSTSESFFCTTGPNSQGTQDVVLAKANGERLKTSLTFTYKLVVTDIFINTIILL